MYRELKGVIRVGRLGVELISEDSDGNLITIVRPFEEFLRSKEGKRVRIVVEVYDEL